ncbi:hypothetical protein Kpho02_14280 [Kitasatospora phosalacinea]|uniref:Uncharacterized protein n=1 Tax=Kitasatospora phosalacinea TaxID=2065 RepID=A0A9W6Q5W0_9ACTN|nr:hypothetical protein Kpho02_14280 [Kitasatospora phosalacinea]
MVNGRLTGRGVAVPFVAWELPNRPVPVETGAPVRPVSHSEPDENSPGGPESTCP